MEVVSNIFDTAIRAAASYCTTWVFSNTTTLHRYDNARCPYWSTCSTGIYLCVRYNNQAPTWWWIAGRRTAQNSRIHWITPKLALLNRNRFYSINKKLALYEYKNQVREEKFPLPNSNKVILQLFVVLLKKYFDLLRQRPLASANRYLSVLYFGLDRLYLPYPCPRSSSSVVSLYYYCHGSSTAIPPSATVVSTASATADPVPK